jgi:hypothetical protein
MRKHGCRAVLWTHETGCSEHVEVAYSSKLPKARQPIVSIFIPFSEPSPAPFAIGTNSDEVISLENQITVHPGEEKAVVDKHPTELSAVALTPQLPHHHYPHLHQHPKLKWTHPERGCHHHHHHPHHPYRLHRRHYHHQRNHYHHKL